ncbi:hypothetical protein ABEU20_004480 [Rhodococcus sp. PAM 2766]|uniref:Transmembrane protein n=1 Tax=Rhodococcus parequi TaxID=3137122 RepID=A0ABW9FJY9_9NOCA
MTEPEGDSQAISVAELLARNGQRVGAGGGGRRRRGVKGGISVAELTGEFQAVRTPTSETPESESETPESATPAAETSAPESPAPEAPVVEQAEPEKPEPSETKAAEAVKAEAAEAAPKRDLDATAAFSLADADAADKAAADKAAADKAAADKTATDKTATDKTATDKAAADKPDEKPAPEKPADDAPTLITPAVAAGDRKADDRKVDTGWRSATTTVLEPVPAPSLAHSVEPEPRLLSGQAVAGDLLRRDGASAPTPDAVAATDVDRDDESPAAPEDLPAEPSAAKQWAVLLGQGAVALVAGALMFKGFEKLWDMLPMVALILAVLVIVGLVAMVRILRRTDDITSLVIAVVAGVFVTLGPLAFLLGTS